MYSVADWLSDIRKRRVMIKLQNLVMVHDFLDPWSTGSSKSAKGRQAVLVQYIT